MRSIAAMIRASFLTAASYRFDMMLSIAGLLVALVPVYFVSGALQQTAEESIRSQGGVLFGFLVVGMAATYLFTAAVATPPRALSGAISSGTLEALLVTRTPLPLILIGLVGYGLLWNALRVAIVVAAAAVVGLHVTWGGAPLALAVLALMVVAYFAIGLLAASLVLVFRTSGPVVGGVLVVSALLGGVYYPTSVIPVAWLERLTAFVPALYALRPARQLLLAGASAADVVDDVLMLSGYAAVLLAVSMLVFAWALRYARSAGTLAQY